MVTISDPNREGAPAMDSSTDSDFMMRGRTRDRSLARSKPMRPDESSTLRGRSRRRSISPSGRPSRATSPAGLPPVSRFQMSIHDRLRDTRREHCPSRVSSPFEMAFRRRQRTRSRSRGPCMEQDLHRTFDTSSRLRNEIFLSDEETAGSKKKA